MTAIGSAANTAATKSLEHLGENQMTLDEMTMTDLAAMFAMMGLLARKHEGGEAVVALAYAYADEFIEHKQEREEYANGRD